ncbi:SDR family NAD(P)-dependent oxidoreductase [Agrobacterium tumefaciens]|uniref:SDR family NAD(P)-dependent oxidoreductase n=1 Tax=Agrobacterium tumefaciens TaxID=358 RepID=UPI003BA35405
MAVEILGRACVAPSAKNVQELLILLKQEKCAVTAIPAERWNPARFWHPARSVQGKAYTFAAGVIDDVFEFDAALFGLSAREAAQMDPQQRILLQTVWRALEDARINPQQLKRERVGVYIGASSLDSGNLQVEDPASGGPHFMTGNTLSIISNRISHIFGLKGPSMTIDTACSSSLVALHHARQALEDEEIDTAIVGGVNLLLHPFPFVGFSQARMLSPEGLCRAYAENGEGYVRAEGAGAVILRRADRVAGEGARSRATLVASGVNSSGRTNGISLPSREAQAQLLSSLYNDTGLDCNDLVFVEGHGTGTKVGDPAELWAIGTVIAQGRSKPLPIGSIKSNIGHAEPASGILGLIKAMLALENDFLPATLHADVLNQTIDFDGLNIEVNRAARPIERGEKRRLAGINSFGFGGTNVHVVISDPPEPIPVDTAPFKGLFVLSAHTQSALESLLQDYVSRLSSSSAEQVEQLVSSSNNMALKHRFAAFGDSASDIASVLSGYLRNGEGDRAHVGQTPGKSVKTVFVYAGNGSQWAGMGLDAYKGNPDFRAKFDAFGDLFLKQAGLDLSALLEAGDLERSLRDTRVAQPILFAIQAALTDCLVEKGVKPDFVLGHSVGEVAAAYSAGILSAKDAVTIVAVRSRHQHSLAGQGAMAAAVMSEAFALGFAKEHGLDNIVVAGINSHNSVTISGPIEEIKQFKALSQVSRHVVHVLDIDYPFHHPIIDSEKMAFLRDMPPLAPKSGHTPFISTVTGSLIDGAQLDSEYWWKNVREPIAFEAAVSLAVENGGNLFLEISPRPILSSYVTETVKQQSAAAVVLPTLSRPGLDGDSDPVTSIVLRAVAHGVDVPSTSMNYIAPCDLPIIPFENVSYRPTSTTDGINLFGRDGADGTYTLLGWRTDPNSSAWKNHLDAQLFPDLAGHVVDGKPILPGSAFIEIALQAARQFYDVSDVEITNLEIFRPLELRETKLIELSTKLSPETGFIEIASREYLSDNGWTIHATARSRKPTESIGSVRLRPSSTAKVHQIGGAEAYQTARSFGLDYAACFQLLKKAEVYNEKHILVELQPAAAPVHPYLSYGLDPVSTDAAFHGLVALFALLTGEADGAPYIPVRFGSVRFASSAKAIASAVIEIQRFSPHSLKARIDLIAADGTLVSSLDDCRFRRTWLRQHTTLETATFHYEAVPDAVEATVSTKPAKVDGRGYLPMVDSIAPAEGTIILTAAVLRASFDVARLLADGKDAVTFSALPGNQGFQCYLSSCLYALEDAGMVQSNEEGWLLRQPCELPSVEELLGQINIRFPDRVAEAVLVNNAYRETLARLSVQSSFSRTEGSVSFMSEATMDHVRHHTAFARERESLVLAAVENALGDVQQGDGFTIIEICAVSPAFSQRLAELAALKGAQLIIAEPSDHLRRTLEIAFERNPSISCLDLDNPVSLTRANLVVSASGDVYGKLSGDKRLQAVQRIAGSAAATVAIVDLASSGFADFVFGLTDGWFSGSATPEFPIGKFATEAQWRALLAECGFSQTHIRQHESAHGALLLVEAQGPGALEVESAKTMPFAAVVEIVDGEHASSTVFEPLRCTTRGAEAEFATFFTDKEGALAFVFDTRRQCKGSDCLQDAVQILSALAEAARKHMRSQNSPSRARLLVLADGGSPAGSAEPDPTASGVWAFSRVLQNEYDELEVFLLDPVADGAMRLNAISMILSCDGREREWVQDRRTALLSVVRAVPGHARSASLKTKNFESATIRQLFAGRIDSISWEQNNIPAPAAGEVSVRVAATGLNFRDVMWSMGLLPEEALEDGFAGATIGMEMSGTVVAVGEGVTDLVPGDEVMGIASQALSTHITVARDGLSKIPAGIDLAAAATVPVAFLTAYYAMVELGRIGRGETILIHGAAGGVGLAALQIAKLRGAKVIATAGTVEKRRFLSLLGADHVFDSRSLAFVGDVLRVTDDKGVELVLNSLFAEAMERSFELLKPFGRFLELGKRDYYSDRKLALRPFRRNISYFGIDADQLLINAPELTRRIFREIGTLFAEGKLVPLPYRSFNYDETAPAFRLMQNAGHIGKIIIRPPQPKRDAVQKSGANHLELNPGVYLVVGGIGGFGLAAADWLASRGATHVALCSRRGVPDEETLAATTRWNAAGIASSVHSCDVTDEASLDALLKKLRVYGPVKGVVHAAMVLDDALISNLDRQRNRAVIEVKANGAGNLDRLTRKDELELFLLFSSATTMIGNPGQANYVAANGYLEGLARLRRAAGLPGVAVGFGAIADAGFLTRNTGVNDILARRIGKTALTAKRALSFVERVLLKDGGTIDEAVVMVAEIDWTSAASLPLASQPLFSAIPRTAISNAGGGEGDRIDLATLVAGKTREEASALLHEFLAAEISSILKVAEDSIKSDKALKDIGLDSLMAMELGASFQQKSGIDIPFSGMGESATIGDIVQKLYDKVVSSTVTDREDGGQEDASFLAALAEKHGAKTQERKTV